MRSSWFVSGLYKKGFVYLDVPIHESDRIIVPPLEGFVMNRVLGDYFETLLYKIFVSLDEHTPIREVNYVLIQSNFEWPCELELFIINLDRSTISNSYCI